MTTVCYMSVWAELCTTTPNLYAEFLILSVTLFGDRSFEEIINTEWSHNDRAYSE